MTSRSDSESSASPRFVEPLRSEKTIVTVFRTSCGGATGASGVPQKPQRRKRSGFSSPHDGQIAIRRVYAGLRGILSCGRGRGGGRSTSSSASRRSARAAAEGRPRRASRSFQRAARTKGYALLRRLEGEELRPVVAQP